MTGFPARISRSSLGPKPRNRYPVKDPSLALDGPTIGDLILWQLSGMNVVSDKAWILLSAAGAVVAHGESWDPDRLGVAPTVVHVGAGVYTVTYAATYLDKDGTAVAPALVAGKAYPQGTAAMTAVASVAGDGRTVTVSTFNSAAAATDSAVLLEVK